MGFLYAISLFIGGVEGDRVRLLLVNLFKTMIDSFTHENRSLVMPFFRRRQRAKRLLLFILTAYIPAALVLAMALASERPNFVFIIADDQAPGTLSVYGNTLCQTPHLDRLAARGVVFDGAYHMGANTGAVCTASRHMVMTGRTLWHVPVANGRTAEHVQAHCPPMLEKNSMAAIFNRAGYDTMRTCKEGNSYSAANEQFTTVRDQTSRMGDETAKSSHWHGQQVIEFLDQREKSAAKDPFLIYMGFSHPHDERNGTTKLLKTYGAYNDFEPGESKALATAPPLPVSWLPEHPFHHGHIELRDEERVPGVLKHRDTDTVRNEIGREYACIEYMDEQIGRVLARLEAMGELENTYIFFTSDHGIAVGKHGLMGKQNLYEHSWRVPYIVSGPSLKAGTRAKGNIYLLDSLPTMLDLAGLKAPSTVEGLSFRSVLEGKKPIVRETLYGAYCGGTKPGMRALKHGDWKLIKYDVLDGKVRETQLFHLAENPDELLIEHHAPAVVRLTGNQPLAQQKNLAKEPEYQAKLTEMEELLHAEMKKHDDPYRFWDQKGLE